MMDIFETIVNSLVGNFRKSLCHRRLTGHEIHSCKVFFLIINVRKMMCTFFSLFWSMRSGLVCITNQSLQVFLLFPFLLIAKKRSLKEKRIPRTRSSFIMVLHEMLWRQFVCKILTFGCMVIMEHVLVKEAILLKRLLIVIAFLLQTAIALIICLLHKCWQGSTPK